MKKSNIFKIGLAILGAFALIVMFAPAMLPWMLGSGAFYATTGTIISGDAVDTSNASDAEPDLLLNTISQKITEMKPARTPLDTIVRSAVTKKKIESFRTDFYAVDVRPFSDTVATTYTKPSTGVELAELVVTNIDIWSQDDTVLVVGVTGSDSLDLVLFVADVDVANSILKVQALNGTAEGNNIVVPTIASTTVLVRMGVAKAEKDAQTSPYAMIPEKDYNYCQIFMAQVEESTYMAMHKKEVQWSFSDYEALNIYDMKTTIELSFLFGYRRQFTDKLGRDSKYTCGGITRSIDKNLEYGTGGSDRVVTNDTLIDWCADAFTGNSGSDTRIMFAGADLTAYISKIDFQKNLGGNQTESKWGIEWKVISTNFGRILWKLHPLFAQIGWGEKGVLLDVNNLEKHEFLPMQTREVDLIKSGQKNVNAKVIDETSCPVLRYPDTHRIIKPKA
jgi:hypothetical protein